MVPTPDKQSAGCSAANAGTSPYWLRANDRKVVASLVAFGLLALAISWFALGGSRGGLVELKEIPQGTIQYQVDLNNADWPELIVLPGIGEKLAKVIVADRELNGPFRSIDDLDRVRGIGRAKLGAIRPFLRPINPAANLAAGSEAAEVPKALNDRAPP